MKKNFLLACLCLLAWNTAKAQNNPPKDYKKAEKLYESYEYAAAIPFYQSAVQSDSLSDAIVKLADCYRRLNQYEKAEYWYRIVADKGIGEPVDRLFYGIVLKANGKYMEAKQQFLIYRDAAPIDARGVRLANSCDIALRILDEPSVYKAELAPGINSPRNDFSPARYKNGVVFTSTRDGGKSDKINKRSGDPYTDLYYAEKLQDGNFGPAKSFDDRINTMADEGPATFDSTGTLMFFTKTVVVRGNPDLDEKVITKLRIYKSEFKDGKWSTPESMHFNSDRYNVAHPALSRDGRRLYFSSDMNSINARGGKDLYVSERTPEGKWGSAINMGPLINTEGDEAFPYIHDDGTLYFASDLHDGLGGYDLFYSEQREGVFSEPKNMMKGINSSFDDFGILLEPDKKSGFITSNRPGGIGSDDIYYIFRAVEEPDTLAPPPLKPTYLVVSGRVIEVLARKNGNDWEKIRGEVLENASLLLSDNGRRVNETTSAADGTYSFDVEDPDNYIIIGKKTGYWVSRNKIDKSKMTEDGKVVMDIELEKIVLNEPNPNGKMPNVNFDFDKYSIPERNFNNLELVTGLLKENEKIQLELAGHTDPRGSNAYNMALSIKRANAVQAYLMKNGIEQDRIIPKGYGENRLLVKNPKTEAENALNRRAEFIVRKVDYTSTGSSSAPIDGGKGGVNPKTGEKTGGAASASGDVYEVKQGDTLYQIAKKYNVGVVEIMRKNDLKSELIRPGQKLKIN